MASVWPFSTESCSKNSHAPSTNWLERMQIHHQLALQYPPPPSSPSLSLSPYGTSLSLCGSFPVHLLETPSSSLSWHDLNLCSLHSPPCLAPTCSTFQWVIFCRRTLVFMSRAVSAPCLKVIVYESSKRRDLEAVFCVFWPTTNHPDHKRQTVWDNIRSIKG